MRIVIIGGGFGGISVYKNLRSHLQGTFSITLINKHNFFWFTPMLHEVATGSVTREHVTVPLREIIRHHDDSFVRAEVTFIDTEKRMVHTSEGSFPYDQLVLALGSVGSDRGVIGVSEYAYQFRFIEDGVMVRNKIIEQFEKATRLSTDQERATELQFVIVGGGLTGSELAAQLSDWVEDLCCIYKIKSELPVITLLHGGPCLVPQLHITSSKTTERILLKKGIHVMCNAKVAEVTSHSVVLADKTHVQSSLTVWTAGFASPLHSLLPDGLLDEQGWLRMKSDGRVEGFLNVWGVGDSAHGGAFGQIPQTAQAAEQVGEQIAHNLIRLVKKQPTLVISFSPKGNLVPLGDWNGVAEIGKIRFNGKFAWWMRRTVFILRLPTMRDRLGVIFDWTLRIFGPRDTSEWK